VNRLLEAGETPAVPVRSGIFEGSLVKVSFSLATCVVDVDDL
jgi:hypothetical protein